MFGGGGGGGMLVSIMAGIEVLARIVGLFGFIAGIGGGVATAFLVGAASGMILYVDSPMDSP